MGDRSSDKYYYGTPIHQTDRILTCLLAVNESLGFSETSPGDVKPEHMVDGGASYFMFLSSLQTIPG